MRVAGRITGKIGIMHDITGGYQKSGVVEVRDGVFRLAEVTVLSPGAESGHWAYRRIPKDVLGVVWVWGNENASPEEKELYSREED